VNKGRWILRQGSRMHEAMRMYILLPFKTTISYGHELWGTRAVGPSSCGALELWGPHLVAVVGTPKHMTHAIVS